MPASIHNAARWFSRETFSIWNPQTGDFYGELIGRKKRIDAFVSLWHRSTRREHLYFLPEAEQQYDLTQAVVLRHDNSGTLYLISETIERDYWINDSQYVTMVRAHRVVPPSGGPAQFFPVRVQGSGDDLGPVVIGPAQACYADTELRSTHKTEDSEETSIGEYFVAYSRNIEGQEGDFISVGGVYYRFMELHSDSGYRYSRASQESPKFKTVEFKLPAGIPSIFDPVTGTMTSSDEVSRQVSVLVGDEIAAGRVAEHKVDESMTLFIYLNHIGFEPYLGQTVIRDGRKYRVISKNLRIEEKQIKLEVAP